jgi:hypothetical protein
MRYLQINEASVVTDDMTSSSTIDAPHCIPVADDDPATLGWTWDGETFAPPPAPAA